MVGHNTLGSTGYLPFTEMHPLLCEVPRTGWDNYSPFVGIEIELENCKLLSERPAAPSTAWQVVGDSSLKLPHSYEVRSKKPTPATDVHNNHIPALYSQLMTSKTLLPQSDRAGIHVHYNILNMTEQQIRRSVCTFLLAERIIFSYLPEHRQTSIFATPIFQSTQLQEFVLALFSYIKEAMDGGHHLLNYAANTFWTRYGAYVRAQKTYSSLNLSSMFSKGTVELRLFNSSDDIDDWLFALNVSEWVCKSFVYWNNPSNAKEAYNYLLASTDGVFGFTDLITSCDNAYKYVEEAWPYVELLAKEYKFPYKRDFNQSALVPASTLPYYHAALSDFNQALIKEVA